MRLSEFRRAVTDEFGDSHGRVLCEDLVLGALASRTANDAIASGTDPRVVWVALCDAMGVDRARRHGVGLVDPSA